MKPTLDSERSQMNNFPNQVGKRNITSNHHIHWGKNTSMKLKLGAYLEGFGAIPTFAAGIAALP